MTSLPPLTINWKLTGARFNVASGASSSRIVLYIDASAMS